jgi:hypothetical protein
MGLYTRKTQGSLHRTTVFSFMTGCIKAPPCFLCNPSYPLVFLRAQTMCLRSKKSTYGRAAPASGAGFRAIFGRKKAREAYWPAGFRGFYDALHSPNEKAPLGAGFVAEQQKKKPLPGLHGSP